MLSDAGGVGTARGYMAGVATRVDGLAGKICTHTMGVCGDSAAFVSRGKSAFAGGIGDS